MTKTIFMSFIAFSFVSCGGASQPAEAPWRVDGIDDVKVIRYAVPGVEELHLEREELNY